MTRSPRPPRSPMQRRIALARHRASRLNPTVKGLCWATLAGFLFVMLNTVVRSLTLQMEPLQAQFLRYLAALVVMLPLVARAGVSAYKTRRLAGQFARGAMHTVGLVLWFSALARIPMADTTAIGFTTPIFIMVGAFVLFRETMQWARWVAAAIGFAGVLIVVGPKLSGGGGLYSLLMLASSPVFAASFLMTKSLTRSEPAEVIVFWQAVSVSLFSLPMAVMYWSAPSALQWIAFLGAGVLGVASQYCVTRAFEVADISSTQSVKFLDLVWAAAMGWLVFAEVPSRSTLIGGAVICAATIWIAHREARVRPS